MNSSRSKNEHRFEALFHMYSKETKARRNLSIKLDIQ